MSTRVSNLQPICDLIYNYIVYTHSASELIILEVFSTFEFDFFSLRKQTTSTTSLSAADYWVFLIGPAVYFPI